MKRYLIAIVAILLAVGLNSFTSKDSTVNTSEKEVLFWYSVDASGNLVASLGQIDRSQVVANTNCKDQVDPVCAKGYNSAQTAPGPAPAPAATIKSKTNP